MKDNILCSLVLYGDASRSKMQDDAVVKLKKEMENIEASFLMFQLIIILVLRIFSV